LAVVGTALLVIIISSVEAVHGAFAMVQRKVFGPTPRAVIPETGLVGVEIVPAPLTSVQVPVPTTGVFAAIVAVVAQTAWSGPAFDTVGFLLNVITTSSVDAAHGAFAMVHLKV
jgi:hypothetical protein